MKIEFDIKIETLEELENALSFEQIFNLLKIYPVGFYDPKEKIKNIYINTDDYDNIVVLNDKNEACIKIKYNSDEELSYIMSMGGLLYENRINFNVEDNGEYYMWYFDEVTGPMTVTFKD